MSGTGTSAAGFTRPVTDRPPPPAPRGLPLTRRALAAWPRWREARTPGERERLRPLLSLHAAEAAALDLLRKNLKTAGSPLPYQGLRDPGWFHGALLAGSVRQGVLETVLAGLALPEESLSLFVQVVGLGDRGEGRWLLRALRRHLGLPPEPAPPAARKADAGGVVRGELWRYATAAEPGRGDRQPWELPGRKERGMETTSEEATRERNGAATKTERLAAALARRGLSVGERIPVSVHAELAREIESTSMAVSTYLAALRRQTGVKLSPGGAPAPGPAASNGHAPRAAKPALSSAFTSATPADTSALVSNEAACKSDEPLPPRPLAGIAARVRRELAILGHDPLPEFVPFPDRLSVAKALEMTVADVSAALVELRGEEPGEDAPGRAAAERVPAPEGPQDAPGADSDAFAAPERSTAPEPEPEDVARLRAENEQLRRELQWVTSERESAQELADERGDLRRLLAATEERLAKESACRAELELELEATREVMVAAAGMTETPTLRELREELTRDQRRLALQFAHELVNNPLRACLEGSNHAVEARLAMARLAIRIVEEALG